MAETRSFIDKVEENLAVQEQQQVQQNNSKEKVKYILVGIALCLSLIGVLAAMLGRNIPKGKYLQAIEAYEAGNYASAAKTFEKLNDYESSEYYLDTIYTQYPHYRFLNAKEGDMVIYGSYVLENTVANIEWYVLEKTNDSILLISRHILDAQPYTGIEQWLDETFRNTAFTGEQSENVTEIFLLDRAQFTRYLEGKEYAACQPTTFAKNRGYWTNYAGNHMWWSSESSSSGKHFVASPYGSLGRNVDEDSGMNGIRPTIRISLS